MTIYNQTQVRVYRNLTKHCYSVQTYVTGKGWRLAYHTERIVLSDATFIIHKSGQQKTRKEKKKFVHAYICGTRCADSVVPNYNKRVAYNPYTCDTFMMNNTPIHNADCVILDKNGVHLV